MTSTTNSLSTMDRVLPRLSLLEQLLCCPPQHERPQTRTALSPFDLEAPAKLIRKYLTKSSKLKLRGTSQLLSVWIGTEAKHYNSLFGKLYITADTFNLRRGESLHALGFISKYCKEITIRVTPQERHSSQIFQDDLPKIDQGKAAPDDGTHNPVPRGDLDEEGESSEQPLLTHRPSFTGRGRSQTLAQLRHIEQQRKSHTATNVPEPGLIPPYDDSIGPFGSQSGTQLESDWLAIFEEIVDITTITISIDPDTVDKGWGTFGQVESTIVSIRESMRAAIRNNRLKHFHTLRLAPIHAFGIMHCSWKEKQKKKPGDIVDDELWHRVKKLEVQLINPRPYLKPGRNKRRSQTSGSSASDYVVMIKQLHDWICSFAARCIILCFHWVGEAGPDPLALDLLITTRDFSDNCIVQWPRLDLVELSNTHFEPLRSFTLWADRAPSVRFAFLAKRDPAFASQHFVANFQDVQSFIDYSELLLPSLPPRAHDSRLPIPLRLADWALLPVPGPEDPFDLRDLGEELSDDEETAAAAVAAFPSFDGIPAEDGWWM